MNIHSQPVGIFAHDLKRVGPVGAIDAHGIGGRDAVRLQKEHEIADASVRGPALLDALQPLLAHAVHGKQPIRLLVQNTDGVRAEGIHNAPGQTFPHALNQPRGKIEPDALAGDGQHFLKVRKLQLAAETRIVDPAPLHAHMGSCLRADGMADAGHGISADAARGRALDLGFSGQSGVRHKAEDGIAVFLIVEDHALQRAGQLRDIGIGKQRQIGHQRSSPPQIIRSCISSMSASVRAVMAESTGTMRGMAERSCRPPISTEAALPFLSMVC